MNKTLIGLGTLFSAISLGFNGNYSSANTQTTNTGNTPNVRVLNNNTVSPTSSAPKSINSVNTQSNLQSNVNVKENSNSASNIYKKSSEQSSTATSTVSVKLIRPVITSSQSASNSLAKQFNDYNDYKRQINNSNNGKLSYNADGTGYYSLIVSDSSETQINGVYHVYQDGHIDSGNTTKNS